MRLILFQIFTTLLFLNCSNEPIVTESDILKPQTKINIIDTSVYTIVEKMPILADCEFEENPKTCSDRKLLRYIHENLKYETNTKEDDIESLILCSFIIEKNGEISNIKTLKGSGLSNIKKVLAKMDRGIPGKENGFEKRVKITFPIRVNWE